MSERRPFCRLGVLSKSLTVACAMLVGLPQYVLADDCLKVSLHGLQEFEAAPATAPSRTTFRLNERFVLCVELDANMFLTIWDAPPMGNDIERLFPNRISHPNQTVLAAEVPAARHCFGVTTPAFNNNFKFPLVQDEGPGNGKITVVASTSLADQPTMEDYKIPGKTLKAAAARQLIVTASKTCESKLTALVQYEVTK
jgi:hypothetical protein